MLGLWMGGLGDVGDLAGAAGTGASAARASSMAQEARLDVKELTHQVQRLSLLNQALWELIRGRLNLTDAELERMAAEIDLRDGLADGKISATAVRCPNCNRVSNSRHFKCLYCGQLFEKPLFG